MGLTRSPLQLLEEATEAHMPGRVPSFASCILRCPSAQSQGAGLAHSEVWCPPTTWPSLLAAAVPGPALPPRGHTPLTPDIHPRPCAQVLEMVERLDEAVRTELTTLEEVLTQRMELVAAARGARRQAETMAQQLQGLAFWRGVPLSPVQVAEDVSFVEEYRWVGSFPVLGGKIR